MSSGFDYTSLGAVGLLFSVHSGTMVQGFLVILPQICAFFPENFGFSLEPATFSAFFGKPYLLKIIFGSQGEEGKLFSQRY